jgi:DNA-binding GntR family transcriptional regulator
MMQDAPLLDLSPVSLVELVVSQLRGEILGGQLQPGERLVEEQITRRFGISRAPLREAMRLLAQQGMVEHLPRRGARVATLSDADADELFEIRDVLERFAMQRALPLPDTALGPMREELAAMRLAAVRGDILALADAHRRFHIAVVALAGQRQLVLAYEPILLKLQMHMALNLRRESEQVSPLDGVRRHATLLDAVATNDLDVVLKALSEHGTHAYLR